MTDDAFFDQPKSHKQGDSAALFVSLYVVLLAFFIVLNSISSQNGPKKQKAVGSVRSAFDSTIPVEAVDAKISVGLEMLLAQFNEDLQEITREIFALEKIPIIRQGNSFIITFKRDMLFLPGTAKLNDRGLPFLQRLQGEFLDMPQLEISLRVEGHMYPALQNSPQPDQPLIIEQLANFTDLLKPPKEAVLLRIVGLQKEVEPEQLRLIIDTDIKDIPESVPASSPAALLVKDAS